MYLAHLICCRHRAAAAGTRSACDGSPSLEVWKRVDGCTISLFEGDNLLYPVAIGRGRTSARVGVQWPHGTTVLSYGGGRGGFLVGGAGGWKNNSWKRHTVFSAQPTPRGWGGYAIFFLTHMNKNFTKQSHFKAKIVHVDLLTPSLHQCEDSAPAQRAKRGEVSAFNCG